MQDSASPAPKEPQQTTPAIANGFDPFAQNQSNTGSQSQTTTPNQSGEDPGKTLGIISLIASIIGLGLVGVVLGFIARHKSKLAGFKNGFALAGIILGIIGMVIGTIILLLFGSLFYKVFSECNELGPGVHQKGATTITCGEPNDEGFTDNTTTRSDTFNFDDSSLQSEIVTPAPGVEVTTGQ